MPELVRIYRIPDQSMPAWWQTPSPEDRKIPRGWSALTSTRFRQTDSADSITAPDACSQRIKGRDDLIHRPVQVQVAPAVRHSSRSGIERHAVCACLAANAVRPQVSREQCVLSVRRGRSIVWKRQRRSQDVASTGSHGRWPITLATPGIRRRLAAYRVLQILTAKCNPLEPRI